MVSYQTNELGLLQITKFLQQNLDLAKDFLCPFQLAIGRGRDHRARNFKCDYLGDASERDFLKKNYHSRGRGPPAVRV